MNSAVTSVLAGGAHVASKASALASRSSAGALISVPAARNRRSRLYSRSTSRPGDPRPANGHGKNIKPPRKMKVPRGSGVPPRCDAAVTSNVAAARPAPTRRDAAPTGSLRDFHGKASTSSARCPGALFWCALHPFDTLRGLRLSASAPDTPSLNHLNRANSSNRRVCRGRSHRKSNAYRAGRGLAVAR